MLQRQKNSSQNETVSDFVIFKSICVFVIVIMAYVEMIM